MAQGALGDDVPFSIPCWIVVIEAEYAARGLPWGGLIDSAQAGRHVVHLFDDEHLAQQYAGDERTVGLATAQLATKDEVTTFLGAMRDVGVTHVGFNCPCPRSERTASGWHAPIRDAIRAVEAF